MGEGAPLNYFLHAFGPAAIPTLHLDWVLATICISVCVIIAGLLLYAILRRRGEEIGIPNENAGIKWVVIGSIISTAILFILTIYMLIVLLDVSQPEQTPALTITVTGYDWWWKVDYEDSDASRHYTTANEIHIPVGKPVLVKLVSADVIHAFWVPELAGKTQMIPGQTNHQWIEADRPGIYIGQCTQYCGVQHAHMLFEVVAQNDADFEKWEASQRAPAKTTDVGVPGHTLFMERCSSCHTIRGVGADGEHGPDLTHLNSRRMIAAGLLPNTPTNVIRWTTHAQELKPGARMPSMTLTPTEQADLSAYLSTLH